MRNPGEPASLLEAHIDEAWTEVVDRNGYTVADFVYSDFSVGQAEKHCREIVAAVNLVRAAGGTVEQLEAGELCVVPKRELVALRIAALNVLAERRRADQGAPGRVTIDATVLEALDSTLAEIAAREKGVQR